VPITIVRVEVSLQPLAFVATSFTVKVPAVRNAADGLASVELPPFPNIQKYEAAPNDALVNDTVNGGHGPTESLIVNADFTSLTSI
jgi:hypothetical protein